MNNFVGNGRVAQDFDMNYADKTAVVTLRVAFKRDYTPKEGQPDADFLDVTVWGKQAETVNKYVGKGDMIGIEGQIRTKQSESNGKKYNNVFIRANRVEFLTPASMSSKNNDDRPAETKAKNEQNAGYEVPF